MTKAELKTEALREPKAGDVWTRGKFKRRIVAMQDAGFTVRLECNCCNRESATTSDWFFRWAQTAELVRRGA